MGLFSKREDTTAITSNEDVVVSAPDDVLLSALLNDVRITKTNAMNIAATAACINKISDTIAAIPIKLYKKNAEGDVEEILNDSRTTLLNTETGDTLNANDMKNAIIMDYYLGGGGYVYIHRVNNEVVSLHYVDESVISFMQNVDPIFKTYKILVNGKEYESFDFLKILRNTKNGYSGVAIIEESDLLMAIGLQSNIFQKNLLSAGGSKKGFLQSEKRLSKTALQALKTAFKNLYSNNSENVVVLNEGLAFKEASSNNTELQLDETNTSNNNNICKIFSVPPTIINGNANSLDIKSYINNCITPLCRKFETALNKDLLLEDEKGSYFFAFDIDAALQSDDIKTRYEAYGTGLARGFLQIDEVRKKENLKPLDLDFVKLNLSDVLLNPKNGDIFTPNTGIGSNIYNPLPADATKSPPKQVINDDKSSDIKNKEKGGTDDES